MRWTTSPRLTLELALVRSAMPEADPSAGGLAARMERLERLAGVARRCRAARRRRRARGPRPGRRPAPGNPRGAERVAGRAAGARPGELPRPASRAPRVARGPRRAGAARARAGRRAALDLARDPSVVAAAAERASADRRQMILKANLESATAAAFDGTTLELAFPPGRQVRREKVAVEGGGAPGRVRSRCSASRRASCASCADRGGAVEAEPGDPRCGARREAAAPTRRGRRSAPGSKAELGAPRRRRGRLACTRDRSRT